MSRKEGEEEDREMEGCGTEVVEDFWASCKIYKGDRKTCSKRMDFLGEMERFVAREIL